MREADAEQADINNRKKAPNVDRPEMRIAFIDDRSDGDENDTEKQLPCRVGEGFDRHFRPLYVDCRNGPAERASKRIEDEGRKTIGEQRPDQNRQPGDAQQSASIRTAVNFSPSTMRLSSVVQIGIEYVMMIARDVAPFS